MQIELTSRGLLATFFRHRSKLLSFFLLFFIGGVFVAFTAKPEYESAGSLIVKFGRSAAAEIAETHSNPVEISQNDRREIMQSNMQILQSRDLLRGLITEFGPETLFPDLGKQLRPGDNPVETAITKIQRDSLNVKTALNSDIIDVRLLNGNPQLAADFLHKLFDRFIMLQSDVYNKQQIEFLDTQVKQSYERLLKSQKELQRYKEKAGISSLEEEMKRLLEQKMTAANIALTALDKAKERLEELEAEETNLLATYQPDSPAVRRVRQSLARARQQVEERQRDLDQANAAANATRGSSVLVSGEMARIQRRIEKLEEARGRHDDLQRQVDIDAENYKNYLARSESARINQTLNEQKITRISVLDTPQVATRPSRPRKLLILIVAMLAGAVLGLGAAVIAETLDDRFSSPSQMANTLQLPVMASFFKPVSRS